MRIVLDTNVWLDILVFQDARALALLPCFAQHKVALLLNQHTGAELAHVLERAAVAPTSPTLRAAQASHARQRLLAFMSASQAASQALNNPPENTDTPIDIFNIANIINGDIKYPPNSIKLPCCKDASDQMFLELASQAQAHMIVTHDKALLKCRKYPLSGHVSEHLTGLSMQALSYGVICTPDVALQKLSAE